MAKGPVHTAVQPMYAAAIHHAIAGGSLQEMKGVAAEAEAWVREHGDINAAIEVLKAEIARLEHK